MYKLGCKILIFNGVIFILLGIYAVLFKNTQYFVIDWFMAPAFWGAEKLTEGTIIFKIFAWDFLGMLHIVWGVNIVLNTKNGLIKTKEKWVWNGILISVVVWLFTDIYYTLTVKQNNFFLITLILAFLFITPLVMTKEVLKIKSNNLKN